MRARAGYPMPDEAIALIRRNMTYSARHGTVTFHRYGWYRRSRYSFDSDGEATDIICAVVRYQKNGQGIVGDRYAAVGRWKHVWVILAQDYDQATLLAQVPYISDLELLAGLAEPTEKS